MDSMRMLVPATRWIEPARARGVFQWRKARVIVPPRMPSQWVAGKSTGSGALLAAARLLFLLLLAAAALGRRDARLERGHQVRDLAGGGLLDRELDNGLAGGLVLD